MLFGNLPEMVEFQLEFLKTLEDGTRLVPDLEKLESVDQFKVEPSCKKPSVTKRNASDYWNFHDGRVALEDCHCYGHDY